MCIERTRARASSGPVHVLRELPQVRYVWYDFACMPQGERSAEEQSEFATMLRSCNLLYLGATVLALPDLTYPSRFWTLFEFWLGLSHS